MTPPSFRDQQRDPLTIPPSCCPQRGPPTAPFPYSPQTDPSSAPPSELEVEEAHDSKHSEEPLGFEQPGYQQD